MARSAFKMEHTLGCCEVCDQEDDVPHPPPGRWFSTDARIHGNKYFREEDDEISCTCCEEDDEVSHTCSIPESVTSEEDSCPDCIRVSGESTVATDFGKKYDTVSTRVSYHIPESVILAEDSCPDCVRLSNESSVDTDSGKQYNTVFTCHVPKINGPMPSTDEEMSDYQRLQHRSSIKFSTLKLYNLVELKVKEDGNCQFRALSDQIYSTSKHHKYVRRKVVNQLKSHRETYEGYVPMAYPAYLKMMSKFGEWGDHVTLQAVADSFSVVIYVITSFKDTPYIKILPKSQMWKKEIFLSFWAEIHYNSVYSSDGVNHI